MIINFATQSAKHDSPRVSSERAVNAYAERQPQGAKNPVAMICAPGIVHLTNCGVGPVRGMITLADVLYAVSAQELYRVSGTGTVTLVGSTIPGTDPVSMDQNGEQIAITNGSHGFIYTTAGGLQSIIDADFHAANTVTYADSFFVYDRAGTNEWFISDPIDGTSYSDFFASAEWKPDNVLAVKNHLETLHVLGATSIERWAVTGAANFPYQRIKGAGLEYGVIGPRAFAATEQAIYVVDHHRVARRLGGQPISTHAVTTEWQKYQTVDDCIGFAYTFEAHQFIVFTFPTQGATWVFDETTGVWHERESLDFSSNPLGRWRANCICDAYGRVMVGDRFSGGIGYLDRDTFRELNNTMIVTLDSPPIHAAGKRVFMPWFEVEVQTGVGITGSGEDLGRFEDPQVMLSFSDDSGMTWSEQELWRSMGRAGQYNTVLRWDRLGSFFERRIRLTMASNVRRTLVQCRAPDMYTGN